MKFGKIFKDFFIAFIVCFCGFLFIIGLYNVCNASFDTNDYYVDTYVVESGDTLWGIGSKYCSNHDDIRDWIHEVEKLNDCTANIRPHQCLDIYVAKDLEE